MNDYTFGNFLCALRTEKGLSQAQLGEMLGVTNKAVSKWENGIAKPNTSLLPKLAEILGVTVEELFACKRIEQDAEYENLKNYLLAQRRKYAILSSVFLSLIITLPLLLIEFICVILGFGIPDDVLGPLGSVCIDLAFIISVTAYLIYASNFRHSFVPTDATYTDKFIRLLRRWMQVCAITFGCLFVLMIVAVPLIHPVNSFLATIILSVCFFILIVLIGILICVANIKRLLKIRFYGKAKRSRKMIPFNQWPVWAKICYIVSVILFPILYILSSYADWGLLWILTRILYMALHIYIFAAIIESKKK